MRGGTRVVTVEADPVVVESRLVGGRWSVRGVRRCCVRGGGRGRARFSVWWGCWCPDAGDVRGVCQRMCCCRSRCYCDARTRSSGSGRRSWPARHGVGHRRIGTRLEVPAATVRGWLRVMADRLERVRTSLLVLARRTGVDQPIPKAQGSPWLDLLVALEAARTAVTGRFGPVGVLGPVTMWQLAGLLIRSASGSALATDGAASNSNTSRL